MKKIYTFLSLACFIWILGCEGGMTQDTLTFGQGALGMILGLVGMVFFAGLAGLYGRRTVRGYSRRMGQRLNRSRS